MPNSSWWYIPDWTTMSVDIRTGCAAPRSKSDPAMICRIAIATRKYTRFKGPPPDHSCLRSSHTSAACGPVRGPGASPGRCVGNRKPDPPSFYTRSEEHTSELQSPDHLVCHLLLEKKNCSI